MARVVHDRAWCVKRHQAVARSVSLSMRRGLPAWLLMSALIVALFASGCTRPAASSSLTHALDVEADGAASVHGNITDDAGLPIENANVTVGPRGTMTDAQGQFRLEGLPEGVAQILVAHPDYAPQVREMRLVEGQNLNLDFTLLPLPRSAPYVTTVTDRGMLACALPAGSDGACAHALGLEQKDSFSIHVNRSGLQQVMVELRWESTLPGPAKELMGRLILYVDSAEGENIQWTIGYRYARIALPVAKVFPSADPKNSDVHVHVSVPHLGCPIGCGGDPGSVAWQQPFDLFVSGSYFRDFLKDETPSVG